MSFHQKPRRITNYGYLKDKFGIKRPIRAVKVKGAESGSLVFAVKTLSFPQLPDSGYRFLRRLHDVPISFDNLRVSGIRAGVSEKKIINEVNFFKKRGLISVPSSGSIRFTEKGKAVLMDNILRREK